MKVSLIIQAILLFKLGQCQIPGDIGSPCQKDEDCYSYYACSNGVCTACAKLNAACTPGATGFLEKCCDGTTCEPIPGLNNTNMCRRNNNNCLTDADCKKYEKCLFRLGKCGFCNANGERCTLPYDTMECCSSYCR